MKAITCTVVLLVVALGPAAAQACGVFRVEDAELKRTFSFYAESVRFARGTEPDTVLFRILGTPAGGMRLEDGKAALFEVKGGVLSQRGKAVGSLSGPTLLVERVRYELSVAPAPGERPSQYDVSITRDGKRLLAARAMSFLAACVPETERPGGPAAQEAEVDELRGRLALFLAWRQVARPAVLPAQ